MKCPDCPVLAFLTTSRMTEEEQNFSTGAGCGGCMPIIPAIRRQRQEDGEFEASQGYNSEFQASLGTEQDPVSKRDNKQTKNNSCNRKEERLNAEQHSINVCSTNFVVKFLAIFPHQLRVIFSGLGEPTPVVMGCDIRDSTLLYSYFLPHSLCSTLQGVLPSREESSSLVRVKNIKWPDSSSLLGRKEQTQNKAKNVGRG
jgi:hypothetical protein